MQYVSYLLWKILEQSTRPREDRVQCCEELHCSTRSWRSAASNRTAPPTTCCWLVPNSSLSATKLCRERSSKHRGPIYREPKSHIIFHLFVMISLFIKRNLFTYWNVTWSIDLTDATELLSADRTADDVGHGEEIVAERQKDYRPFGIAKSGRLDPEGQQSEECRQKAQPRPAGHPTLGEFLVFRTIISIGTATRCARNLKYNREKC